MSAITDRVKGMPIIANKIQNSLPGMVTGAKWPYPMVVRIVITKNIAWKKRDCSFEYFFLVLPVYNPSWPPCPVSQCWSHCPLPAPPPAHTLSTSSPSFQCSERSYSHCYYSRLIWLNWEIFAFHLQAYPKWKHKVKSSSVISLPCIFLAFPSQMGFQKFEISEKEYVIFSQTWPPESHHSSDTVRQLSITQTLL